MPSFLQQNNSFCVDTGEEKINRLKGLKTNLEKIYILGVKKYQIVQNYM